MPSTSDGSMPASSSAAVIAWHAISSSPSGSCFANDVWPMPTIAVRSLMVLDELDEVAAMAGVIMTRVSDTRPVRFVVYGAGAVGGVVGARLFQSGADVVLVARGPHHDVIGSDGLRLEAP